MIPLYKFQTNYKECLYEKKLFGNNRREMTEHFKGWVDWLLQFTHPLVEFIDFITKKE